MNGPLLKITALSHSGSRVIVENVREDSRNSNQHEELLRFHGANGALVIRRPELFALVYEIQDEGEAVPAVVPYPRRYSPQRWVADYMDCTG